MRLLKISVKIILLFVSRTFSKNSEKTSPSAKRKSKRRDSFYDEVELTLTEVLGRKVKVYNGRGKGTLEIEFYSADDLKEIANKLGE